MEAIKNLKGFPSLKLQRVFWKRLENRNRLGPLKGPYLKVALKRNPRIFQPFCGQPFPGM